jgi:hypothetical protein
MGRGYSARAVTTIGRRAYFDRLPHAMRCHSSADLILEGDPDLVTAEDLVELRRNRHDP